MFKHLALTNSGLASTLFEPWSQYMPQTGSVQWEQGRVLAGSVCFGLLVWFFCFFVFFDTASISLFKKLQVPMGLYTEELN